METPDTPAGLREHAFSNALSHYSFTARVEMPLETGAAAVAYHRVTGCNGRLHLNRECPLPPAARVRRISPTRLVAPTRPVPQALTTQSASVSSFARRRTARRHSPSSSLQEARMQS